MGGVFSKCIQDISCENPQSNNDSKNSELEKLNRSLLNCDANSNYTGSRSFVNFCKQSSIYDVKVLQKYNNFTGLQQFQIYFKIMNNNILMYNLYCNILLKF